MYFFDIFQLGELSEKVITPERDPPLEGVPIQNVLKK